MPSFGGGVLALAGGGSTDGALIGGGTITGSQILTGTGILGGTLVFMEGMSEFGPGIGTVAQGPGNSVPTGLWPAIMKDGRVFVHHMHNLANKLANGGVIGPEDEYGFVLLDAIGKVIKVLWQIR